MSPAGNRRRAITLLTGLSIAGLLTTLDISIGSSLVLVGLVVFAPLVVALFGDPRDVALVGASSIAAVVASGIWNDNFGDGVYVQRVLVCTAVTVIAVLAARNRTRTARDRGRFAVLSATAEIADGTRSLEDTITSLHDLLVPTIADVCTKARRCRRSAAGCFASGSASEASPRSGGSATRATRNSSAAVKFFLDDEARGRLGEHEVAVLKQVALGTAAASSASRISTRRPTRRGSVSSTSPAATSCIMPRRSSG